MREVEHFSWRGEDLWTEKTAWTRAGVPERMGLPWEAARRFRVAGSHTAGRERAARDGLQRQLGIRSSLYVLPQSGSVLTKDSNLPRKTIPWIQVPCPEGLPGVLTTTH